MADKPEETKSPQDESGSFPPASEVIKAFGGLRPMANKLGIAVSTVQGWSNRGHIPEARQGDVLTAAAKHGISLPKGTAAPTTLPSGESKPEETTAERKGETATKPEPVKSEPAKTEPAKSEPPKPEPAKTEAVKPSATKPAGTKSEPAKASASTISGAGAPGRRKEKQSALPGMLLGAALLAGGFAIAIATAPQWQPLLGAGQDGATEEALSALNGRIEGLSATVGELEKAVASAPDESAVSQEQIAALSGETDSLRGEIEALRGEVASLEGGGAANVAALSTLEGRLQDLENRAPAVTPGALEDLRSELAAQEARLSGLAETDEALRAEIGEAPAAGDVVLILALNELEEALTEGRDLAGPLGLVRRLGGGDKAVSPVIESLSAAGDSIPTRRALAVEFQVLAQEIVAAGYGEEEQDSLLSGVIERLSRIVSIRPVGDIAGDGTAAVVARAEAELEDLNLAGAVAELEGLTGAPAEAAAGWLATARGRLEAEAGIDAAILALLSRQAGEGN